MDLLKTFECEGGCLKQEPAVDEEEMVELSLGLSLNGRFGVNDRLIRASSYSVVKKEDETTLKRTCSAVEWRSEAKRKRVERLKNGKVVKGLAIEEMKKRKLIRENEPVGSPASAGSSGVSDLETQPFSGLTKDTESKSTASQQSALHSIASERSSAQKIINENQWKDETLKMMLSDMPSVSTKQNGVDGKKIEGFLYRYRKGEQVRIVCVCHGSFLTPAEFVKHGGGGDVEHPLRHIVVNPPSL